MLGGNTEVLMSNDDERPLTDEQPTLEEPPTDEQPTSEARPTLEELTSGPGELIGSGPGDVDEDGRLEVERQYYSRNISAEERDSRLRELAGQREYYRYTTEDDQQDIVVGRQEGRDDVFMLYDLPGPDAVLAGPPPEPEHEPEGVWADVPPLMGIPMGRVRIDRPLVDPSGRESRDPQALRETGSGYSQIVDIIQMQIMNNDTSLSKDEARAGALEVMEQFSVAGNQHVPDVILEAQDVAGTDDDTAFHIGVRAFGRQLRAVVPPDEMELIRQKSQEYSNLSYLEQLAKMRELLDPEAQEYYRIIEDYGRQDVIDVLGRDLYSELVTNDRARLRTQNAIDRLQVEQEYYPIPSGDYEYRMDELSGRLAGLEYERREIFDPDTSAIAHAIGDALDSFDISKVSPDDPDYDRRVLDGREILSAFGKTIVDLWDHASQRAERASVQRELEHAQGALYADPGNPVALQRLEELEARLPELEQPIYYRTDTMRTLTQPWRADRRDQIVDELATVLEPVPWTEMGVTGASIRRHREEALQSLQAEEADIQRRLADDPENEEALTRLAEIRLAELRTEPPTSIPTIRGVAETVNLIESLLPGTYAMSRNIFMSERAQPGLVALQQRHTEVLVEQARNQAALANDPDRAAELMEAGDRLAVERDSLERHLRLLWWTMTPEESETLRRVQRAGKRRYSRGWEELVPSIVAADELSAVDERVSQLRYRDLPALARGALPEIEGLTPEEVASIPMQQLWSQITPTERSGMYSLESLQEAVAFRSMADEATGGATADVLEDLMMEVSYKDEITTKDGALIRSRRMTTAGWVMNVAGAAATEVLLETIPLSNIGPGGGWVLSPLAHYASVQAEDPDASIVAKGFNWYIGLMSDLRLPVGAGFDYMMASDATAYRDIRRWIGADTYSPVRDFNTSATARILANLEVGAPGAMGHYTNVAIQAGWDETDWQHETLQFVGIVLDFLFPWERAAFGPITHVGGRGVRAGLTARAARQMSGGVMPMSGVMDAALAGFSPSAYRFKEQARVGWARVGWEGAPDPALRSDPEVDWVTMGIEPTKAPDPKSGVIERLRYDWDEAGRHLQRSGMTFDDLPTVTNYMMARQFRLAVERGQDPLALLPTETRQSLEWALRSMGVDPGTVFENSSVHTRRNFTNLFLDAKKILNRATPEDIALRDSDGYKAVQSGLDAAVAANHLDQDNRPLVMGVFETMAHLHELNGKGSAVEFFDALRFDVSPAEPMSRADLPPGAIPEGGPVPTFFSAVSRGLPAVFKKRANKEGRVKAVDLQRQIRKQPHVKKEEIEFLGLDEWLSDMAETGDQRVTQQEVQDFIDREGFDFVEVVHRTSTPELRRATAEVARATKETTDQQAARFAPASEELHELLWKEGLGQRPADQDRLLLNFKWGRWTLPSTTPRGPAPELSTLHLSIGPPGSTLRQIRTEGLFGNMHWLTTQDAVRNQRLTFGFRFGSHGKGFNRSFDGTIDEFRAYYRERLIARLGSGAADRAPAILAAMDRYLDAWVELVILKTKETEARDVVDQVRRDQPKPRYMKWSMLGEVAGDDYLEVVFAAPKVRSSLSDKWLDRETMILRAWDNDGVPVDPSSDRAVGFAYMHPVDHDALVWSGPDLERHKDVTSFLRDREHFPYGPLSQSVGASPDEAWDRFRWVGFGGEAPRASKIVSQIRRRLREDPLKMAQAHWEEHPGALLHFRLNRWQGSDGKWVLGIEEIQSDVLQARDRGFRDRKAIDAALAQHRKAVVDLQTFQLQHPVGAPVPADEAARQTFAKEQRRLWRLREATRRALDEALFDPDFPDLPFQDTWHQLALKRIVRMAAEQGIDRIAWTTGLEQSERYSLGAHGVTDIRWTPDEWSDPKGEGKIWIRREHGAYEALGYTRPWVSQRADDQSARDILGEELWRRLETELDRAIAEVAQYDDEWHVYPLELDHKLQILEDRTGEDFSQQIRLEGDDGRVEFLDALQLKNDINRNLRAFREDSDVNQGREAAPIAWNAQSDLVMSLDSRLAQLLNFETEWTLELIAAERERLGLGSGPKLEEWTRLASAGFREWVRDVMTGELPEGITAERAREITLNAAQKASILESLNELISDHLIAKYAQPVSDMDSGSPMLQQAAEEFVIRRDPRLATREYYVHSSELDGADMDGWHPELFTQRRYADQQARVDNIDSRAVHADQYAVASISGRDLEIAATMFVKMYDTKIPNYLKKLGKRFKAKVNVAVDFGAVSNLRAIGEKRRKYGLPVDWYRPEVESDAWHPEYPLGPGTRQNIDQVLRMSMSDDPEVVRQGEELLKSSFDSLTISRIIEHAHKEFVDAIQRRIDRGELGGMEVDVHGDLKHVHYMEIPQRLANAALEEGFPLFHQPDNLATYTNVRAVVSTSLGNSRPNVIKWAQRHLNSSLKFVKRTRNIEKLRQRAKKLARQMLVEPGDLNQMDALELVTEMRRIVRDAVIKNKRVPGKEAPAKLDEPLGAKSKEAAVNKVQQLWFKHIEKRITGRGLNYSHVRRLASSQDIPLEKIAISKNWTHEKIVTVVADGKDKVEYRRWLVLWNEDTKTFHRGPDGGKALYRGSTSADRGDRDLAEQQAAELGAGWEVVGLKRTELDKLDEAGLQRLARDILYRSLEVENYGDVPEPLTAKRPTAGLERARSWLSKLGFEVNSLSKWTKEEKLAWSGHSLSAGDIGNLIEAVGVTDTSPEMIYAKGKAKFSGPAAEMPAKARHDFARHLIASVNAVRQSRTIPKGTNPGNAEYSFKVVDQLTLRATGMSEFKKGADMADYWTALSAHPNAAQGVMAETAESSVAVNAFISKFGAPESLKESLTDADKARLAAGVGLFGPQLVAKDATGKRQVFKGRPVGDRGDIVRQIREMIQNQIKADLARWTEAGRPTKALTNKTGWTRLVADLFGAERGFTPPDRAFAFTQADGADLIAEINRSLTDGQRSEAELGHRLAADFQSAYADGTMSVVGTGHLFLWGILSRRLSPYPHEAMFIDAVVAGIHQHIEAAANGTFDVATYLAWIDSSVYPQTKALGSPGKSAMSNLKDFGRLFLSKMNEKNSEGVTYLTQLHEIMADPEMTGRQKRRMYFSELPEKLGINTKVVSFILLVTGHDDVLVLDRVQIRHLWDGDRKQAHFGTDNMYEAWGKLGEYIDKDFDKFGPWAAVSGPGAFLTSARGVAVYELLEDGLRQAVLDGYEAAGEQGSMGRFHWESWVWMSSQEVSHATLQGLYRWTQAANKAALDPWVGTTVKQGKYTDKASMVQYYLKDEAGHRMFLVPLQDGSFVEMNRAGLEKYLKAIKRVETDANKEKPDAFRISTITGKWDDNTAFQKIRGRERIDAAARALVGDTRANARAVSHSEAMALTRRADVRRPDRGVRRRVDRRKYDAQRDIEMDPWTGERVPELIEGARALRAGDISKADFDALVEEHKPIYKYDEVPAPATHSEMAGALDDSKIGALGEPSKQLKDGDLVGLRLDIPAYDRPKNGKPAWVVAIHRANPGSKSFQAGRRIGYESVAWVTTPDNEPLTMGVVPGPALKIAVGEQAKGTIATIKGAWQETTPEQAKAAADAAMASPEWVQVGMDPERHQYFYTRELIDGQRQAVVGGEEVIQVGPLVLVKNPVYGEATDFLFAPGDANIDQLKRLHQMLDSMDSGLEDQATQLLSLVAPEFAGRIPDEMKDTLAWHIVGGLRDRSRGAYYKNQIKRQIDLIGYLPNRRKLKGGRGARLVIDAVDQMKKDVLDRPFVNYPLIDEIQLYDDLIDELRTLDALDAGEFQGPLDDIVAHTKSELEKLGFANLFDWDAVERTGGRDGWIIPWRKEVARERYSTPSYDPTRLAKILIPLGAPNVAARYAWTAGISVQSKWPDFYGSDMEIPGTQLKSLDGDLRAPGMSTDRLAGIEREIIAVNDTDARVSLSESDLLDRLGLTLSSMSDGQALRLARIQAVGRIDDGFVDWLTRHMLTDSEAWDAPVMDLVDLRLSQIGFDLPDTWSVVEASDGRWMVRDSAGQVVGQTLPSGVEVRVDDDGRVIPGQGPVVDIFAGRRDGAFVSRAEAIETAAATALRRGELAVQPPLGVDKTPIRVGRVHGAMSIEQVRDAIQGAEMEHMVIFAGDRQVARVLGQRDSVSIVSAVRRAVQSPEASSAGDLRIIHNHGGHANKTMLSAADILAQASLNASSVEAISDNGRFARLNVPVDFWRDMNVTTDPETGARGSRYENLRLSLEATEVVAIELADRESVRLAKERGVTELPKAERDDMRSDFLERMIHDAVRYFSTRPELETGLRPQRDRRGVGRRAQPGAGRLVGPGRVAEGRPEAVRGDLGSTVAPGPRHPDRDEYQATIRQILRSPDDADVIEGAERLWLGEHLIDQAIAMTESLGGWDDPTNPMVRALQNANKRVESEIARIGPMLSEYQGSDVWSPNYVIDSMELNDQLNLAEELATTINRLYEIAALRGDLDQIKRFEELLHPSEFVPQYDALLEGPDVGMFLQAVDWVADAALYSPAVSVKQLAKQLYPIVRDIWGRWLHSGQKIRTLVDSKNGRVWIKAEQPVTLNEMRRAVFASRPWIVTGPEVGILFELSPYGGGIGRAVPAPFDTAGLWDEVMVIERRIRSGEELTKWLETLGLEPLTDEAALKMPGEADRPPVDTIFEMLDLAGGRIEEWLDTEPNQALMHQAIILSQALGLGDELTARLATEFGLALPEQTIAQLDEMLEEWNQLQGQSPRPGLALKALQRLGEWPNLMRPESQMRTMLSMMGYGAWVDAKLEDIYKAALDVDPELSKRILDTIRYWMSFAQKYPFLSGYPDARHSWALQPQNVQEHAAVMAIFVDNIRDSSNKLLRDLPIKINRESGRIYVPEDGIEADGFPYAEHVYSGELGIRDRLVDAKTRYIDAAGMDTITVDQRTWMEVSTLWFGYARNRPGGLGLSDPSQVDVELRKLGVQLDPIEIDDVDALGAPSGAEIEAEELAQKIISLALSSDSSVRDQGVALLVSMTEADPQVSIAAYESLLASALIPGLAGIRLDPVTRIYRDAAYNPLWASVALDSLAHTLKNHPAKGQLRPILMEKMSAIEDIISGRYPVVPGYGRTDAYFSKPSTQCFVSMLGTSLRQHIALLDGVERPSWPVIERVLESLGQSNGYRLRFDKDSNTIRYEAAVPAYDRPVGSLRDISFLITDNPEWLLRLAVLLPDIVLLATDSPHVSISLDRRLPGFAVDQLRAPGQLKLQFKDLAPPSPTDLAPRDFAGRLEQPMALEFPAGSGANGGWNVLSLFDGISAGRQALHNVGLPVANYWSSEIDRHAIKVAQTNWPNNQRLGNVYHVQGRRLPGQVDLLVGGSPCQDLRKGRAGLKGRESVKFFEYERLLLETNPRYFLFENTAEISPADEAIVSARLGVEPIMIDAALVSGQIRPRQFWTNIPGVVQPRDAGINSQNVMLSYEEATALGKEQIGEITDKTRAYMDRPSSRRGVPSKQPRWKLATNTIQVNEGRTKTPVMYRNRGKGAPYDIVTHDHQRWRRLARVEVERLQGFPDGYTDSVSRSQALSGLGNSWSVPVIEHILSGLSRERAEQLRMPGSLDGDAVEKIRDLIASDDPALQQQGVMLLSVIDTDLVTLREQFGPLIDNFRTSVDATIESMGAAGAVEAVATGRPPAVQSSVSSAAGGYDRWRVIMGMEYGIAPSYFARVNLLKITETLATSYSVMATMPWPQRRAWAQTVRGLADEIEQQIRRLSLLAHGMAERPITEVWLNVDDVLGTMYRSAAHAQQLYQWAGKLEGVAPVLTDAAMRALVEKILDEQFPDVPYTVKEELPGVRNHAHFQLNRWDRHGDWSRQENRRLYGPVMLETARSIPALLAITKAMPWQKFDYSPGERPWGSIENGSYVLINASTKHGTPADATSLSVPDELRAPDAAADAEIVDRIMGLIHNEADALHDQGIFLLSQVDSDTQAAVANRIADNIVGPVGSEVKQGDLAGVGRSAAIAVGRDEVIVVDPWFGRRLREAIGGHLRLVDFLPRWFATIDTTPIVARLDEYDRRLGEHLDAAARSRLSRHRRHKMLEEALEYKEGRLNDLVDDDGVSTPESNSYESDVVVPARDATHKSWEDLMARNQEVIEILNARIQVRSAAASFEAPLVRPRVQQVRSLFEDAPILLSAELQELWTQLGFGDVLLPTHEESFKQTSSNRLSFRPLDSFLVPNEWRADGAYIERAHIMSLAMLLARQIPNVNFQFIRYAMSANQFRLSYPWDVRRADLSFDPNPGEPWTPGLLAGDDQLRAPGRAADPEAGYQDTLGALQVRLSDRFTEWVAAEYYPDDPEGASQALADPAEAAELLSEYLAEELQIAVRRGDGLIEFEVLTDEVAEAIGDQDVVLFHHTSDAVTERAQQEGLQGHLPSANSRKEAGVYLTTDPSGPSARVYQGGAVALHGGEGVTFEVRVKLADIRPDMDDADLHSTQGRQFVTDYVGPGQIIDFGEPEALFDRRAGRIYGSYLETTIGGKINRIIAIYKGARLGTIWHEIGHLVESLSTPEDMAMFVRVFDSQNGVLTTKGREQLADAFVIYIRSALTPTAGLRGMFRRLQHQISMFWLKVTSESEMIPPEVRRHWNELFRPDRMALDEAFFRTRRQPSEAVVVGDEALGPDLETPEGVSQLAHKERLEAAGIDMRRASIMQALGLKAGAQIGSTELLARTMGYLFGERMRSRFGEGQLTRMTMRTAVPAGRVGRITKEVRQMLLAYTGMIPEDVLKYQTADGVLDLGQAPRVLAGLQTMARELSMEPMGSVIPDWMTGLWAADRSRWNTLSLQDYNRLIEVAIDTRAGAHARRSRAAEGVPPTVGYAAVSLLAKLPELAQRFVGIQSLVDAKSLIVEHFTTISPMQDVVDPGVRELIDGALRDLQQAPTDIYNWAKEIVGNDPELGIRGMLLAMKDHLTPPVLVIHLDLLASLRERLSTTSVDEVLSPTTRDELAAVLSRDGGAAKYTDAERESLATLELIAAERELLETDQGRVDFERAVSGLRYALSKRQALVDKRASVLAKALVGRGQSQVLEGIPIASKRDLYRLFYNGDWSRLEVHKDPVGDRAVSLEHWLSKQGLRTGYEPVRTSRYDPNTVLLEMIVRLRAEEVLGQLGERLALYGLSGSTAPVSATLPPSKFLGAVKGYLNDAMRGEFEAPPLSDVDGVMAYREAHRLLAEWGFNIAQPTGNWVTMLFPDGSQALVPPVVANVIEEAVERVARVGAAETRSSGAAFDAVLGTPELREGAGWREVGRRSMGAAVDAVINEFPLTGSMIQLGVTVGIGLVNTAYFCANFFGAALQVYQGVGALRTVKAGFRHPVITTHVVKQLFRRGRGAIPPKSPRGQVIRAAGNLADRFGWHDIQVPTWGAPASVVAPDGRIYSATMLAEMARREGLDSSYVQAETATALATDIAKLHRPAWLYFTGVGTAYFGAKWWQEILVEGATALDNYWRVGVMIDALKRGESPTAAAELARNTGYDYSALSETEKRYGRFFIMFYSYLKRNQVHFWDTFLRNPDRVLGQLRLARQMMREEMEEEYLIRTPEWYETRMVLRFREALAEQHRVSAVGYLLPQYPVEDGVLLWTDLYDVAAPVVGWAMRGTPGSPYRPSGVSEDFSEDALSDLLSRMTPWTQAPFVFWAGEDIFSGARLEANKNVPPAYIALDMNLTGGYFTQLLDVQPYNETNPARWYTSTDNQVYRSRAMDGKLWWAFRTLGAAVPGGGRNIDTVDAMTRSEFGPAIYVLDSARWMREGGWTFAPEELTGHPEYLRLASGPAAEIIEPRYGLSEQEEFLRLFGVRPVFFPRKVVVMDYAYSDLQRRLMDIVRDHEEANRPTP